MCTIFEIIGGLNTSRFTRHRGNSLIVHIDKLYVTIYSTHLDMTYHNHINFLPARSTMGTISKYSTTLIGFMCIKKQWFIFTRLCRAISEKKTALFKQKLPPSTIFSPEMCQLLQIL